MVQVDHHGSMATRTGIILLGLAFLISSLPLAASTADISASITTIVIDLREQKRHWGNVKPPGIAKEGNVHSEPRARR